MEHLKDYFSSLTKDENMRLRLLKYFIEEKRVYAYGAWNAKVLVRENGRNPSPQQYGSLIREMCKLGILRTAGVELGPRDVPRKMYELDPECMKFFCKYLTERSLEYQRYLGMFSLRLHRPDNSL